MKRNTEFGGACLLAVLMSLVFAFATVQKASAHQVTLESSIPAAGEQVNQAPPQVVLYFSEELDTKQSSLRVFDAQAKQVDLQDGGVDLDDPAHASLKASLPPLPEGVYTVRWVAMLLDGDATGGEFQFAVGSVAVPVAEATQAEVKRSPLLWVVGGGVLILVASLILWAGQRRQKE